MFIRTVTVTIPIDREAEMFAFWEWASAIVRRQPGYIQGRLWRDVSNLQGFTEVHEWESEYATIPLVGGVEVVRFLLEQRGLADRALTPVFGSRSIVSEVLAGKRGLQAKHIQKLADFFGVSPACFFPILPETVVA